MTERTSHNPIAKLPFEFPFHHDSVSMSINGYDLHEMLGTKMRALFQRRRGRDLFDLYWALEHGTSPVDSAAVVDSFLYYLRQEGSQAGREEFITTLDSHVSDRGFRLQNRSSIFSIWLPVTCITFISKIPNGTLETRDG